MCVEWLGACDFEMRLSCGCYSDDVVRLQEMMDSLVTERQELIEQRDSKLKQVTHLAEMVADLKLQLESLLRQDQCKTQMYGMHQRSCTVFT